VKSFVDKRFSDVKDFAYFPDRKPELETKSGNLRFEVTGYLAGRHKR
jgi:hypothetical protein